MVSIAVPERARSTVVTLSVEQVLSRGRVGRAAAMLGPAFVAAIAYVDPGNFSTNFTAGAHYGYRLVWVVVLANLMAMPVQFLSAKVGIVTGLSLPEVCRDHCPRSVAWILWLQAELIAVATDLAEFIGAAVGLNLLFGVPPILSGVITAAAAFVLLGLQTRGARAFERVICFLLLLIVAGFLYQLLHSGTNAHAAVGGLIPSIPSSGALYLSAGIIGATMMPHVVYLHSSMTSRRVECADDSDRRFSLRFERVDVIVALGVAGLINVAMLLIAARVFAHHAPLSTSLNDIHRGLADTLGGGMALAFAGALLVSGVSSSGVGTLAGQTVMAGFLDLRIPLVLRRGVTMVPALGVLALGINATDVLNFSQVVLSFGIPFALVPLLLITRNATIMGSFSNPRWVTAAMSIVIGAVVLLNGSLLYQQFLT